MIIVNADDWGRSKKETDVALQCYSKGRITSASAMVFMEDSIRAADLAKGAGIDIGLHLNLTQRLSGFSIKERLQDEHNRIVRFLTTNKYAFIIFNPALRKQFQYVYQAQIDEFIRLYKKPPSHIDGHQHKHLCTNVLLDKVIPKGEKIRRNFTFWPGEKTFLNRQYRLLVDQWLARRYKLTDYFFDLSYCLRTNGIKRATELAVSANVEIMTHPARDHEYTYLMSDDFLNVLRMVDKGSYASL